MNKKNRNRNNGEPWSRKFGEDENLKNRQYSRSARNSKSKEVAPLLKVLLFLFLAILIIPFVAIYLDNQKESVPEPKSSEQVMINKRIASSSVESSETVSSEVASIESEEQAPTPESIEPESSISEIPVSSPVVVEAPPAVEQAPPVVEEETVIVEEAPPVPTGAYSNSYVIKAGDNLYRIAVNHNMSLDELLQVNGLGSTEAQIGMSLKVK